MNWYKYMEARFANELVYHGKIRINSLNYYKDIEAHGNAVGDREENTLNAVSAIDGTKTGAELSDLEQMVFKPAPGVDPSSFSISNLSIVVPVQGKPSYGFCLSDTLSKELVTKMNEENDSVGNPPYDTCVKITDHVRFVKVLADHLKSQNLGYYGHGHCFYKSRDIAWEEWHRNNDQCPAFIKGLSYSWQKEVRVLFETQSHENIEPIDCEIPELKKLCELIEIPKH
jgi:hypothetical protein